MTNSWSGWRGGGASEAPRGREGLTGQVDTGAAQLKGEQPDPLAGRGTEQNQTITRTSPSQKKLELVKQKDDHSLLRAWGIPLPPHTCLLCPLQAVVWAHPSRDSYQGG